MQMMVEPFYVEWKEGYFTFGKHCPTAKEVYTHLAVLEHAGIHSLDITITDNDHCTWGADEWKELAGQ